MIKAAHLSMPECLGDPLGEPLREGRGTGFYVKRRGYLKAAFEAVTRLREAPRTSRTGPSTRRQKCVRISSFSVGHVEDNRVVWRRVELMREV